MIVDLVVGHPGYVWIPIVVFRADGKPCLCYAPHDEDCQCSVPPKLSDPPAKMEP